MYYCSLQLIVVKVTACVFFAQTSSRRLQFESKYNAV